jgi:aminoglycoside 3-N-acetyltransferase
MAGQLRALGLEQGNLLLVHASLRSLGWVCGGATAVVQALLDVLGPDGTLVVPTFTSDNRDPSRWDPAVPEQWWPTIRQELPPFDPSVTPSQRMGVIAEQVRNWPRACRSTHPHVSFAAVGAGAKAIVSEHPLTCHLGEHSPLRRLEERDARVLLLGVGWQRCTAFHLAEYRQPSPPRREYSCVLLTGFGRQWAHFDDVALDQSDFQHLGEAFETSHVAGSGRLAVGKVGQAVARLFPIRDAVGWAEARLALTRPKGPMSSIERATGGLASV